VTEPENLTPPHSVVPKPELVAIESLDGDEGPGPVYSDNTQLFFLEFCQNELPGHATLEQFTRISGLSLPKAAETADWLWQEGMIQKSPTQFGPVAFILTPHALAVLGRPNGPDDWVSGKILHPDKPASRIRASLQGKIPAPLSNFLLWANILVFAYGGYLCSQSWDTFWHYLAMEDSDPVVRQTLLSLGLVTGRGWEEGKWWLPLQAAFVHVGALHILFNGSALWSIGRHIERMFGPGPFLVMFLASAWLGGCAAVAWYPFGSAGASTAISGFIAADSVWFLMKRKELPRSLRLLWQTQVLVNLGLLAMISFAARVSTAGHAGGALAGAFVAWFWLVSPQWGAWRGLALGWFCLLFAAAGVVAIEVARPLNSKWQSYRLMEIHNRFTRPLSEWENETLIKMMNTHPALRKEDQVNEALLRIQGYLKEAQTLGETLFQPSAFLGEMGKFLFGKLPREDALCQEILDAAISLLEEERDFIDSRLRLSQEPFEKIEKGRQRLSQAVKNASLREKAETNMEKDGKID